MNANEQSRVERLLRWSIDPKTLLSQEAAQDVLGTDYLQSPHPLVGVVCSHLGHEPARREYLARHLDVSMRDMLMQNATLVVAAGTAIEPWAITAAQTYGVPVLRLAKSGAQSVTDPRQLVTTLCISDSLKWEADRLVIALADRIDAIWVRKSGKIEKLLYERLNHIDDGLVRIAIGREPSQSRQLWGLLDAGAVGRYLPVEETRDIVSGRSVTEAASESEFESVDSLVAGEWLVHCTRACDGPWPGQSKQQYQDDLLLGGRRDIKRACIDSLCRIIRMRRLIASAMTSSHRHRVVCFSAVPLPTLLARRTYRRHLHRWDYEPYGVAVRKSALLKIGAQEVVYGDSNAQQELPLCDRFRFQAIGKTGQWKDEQEWRVNQDVDLSRIACQDIAIFVPSRADAARARQAANHDWPILMADGVATTGTTETVNELS